MIYEKIADNDGYFFFKKYQKGNHNKYNPMPHFHNSVEMYVCAEGACQVCINGELRILRAGDVAFVDRLTPHTSGAIDGSAPATVYVVLASSAYLGGVTWLENETMPAFTHSFEGFSQLLSLVEWAYGFKDEMSDDAKCGFITLLMGIMRKFCGSSARVSDKNTRVLIDVMRYISSSYREDITLESLAKRYGYEKTYLSRIFNRLLGMNLREYLNRCRIEAVYKMQRQNPDMPIYKIYSACGFESPNTYYRALKKYTL